MQKRLSSFFLCLLFCLFVYSQDSSQQAEVKKWQITVSLADRFIKASELRKKLSNLGYPEVSTNFFSIEVGVVLVKNKFVIGLESSMPTFGLSSSTSYQLHAFYNRLIFDNNDITIAPGVDFGLQYVQLDIERKNASAIFDSLFLSGGNFVRLANLTPVAGLSVIFHFKKLDNTKSFLLRPFAYTKIGYKQGLLNNSWKAYNDPIANAPADRLSSFYIQIIGGLSFKKS